jgi:hypothetical protein
MAIVALLNESYQRCRLLGGMLEAQRAGDRSRSANPSAGLVGFRMARSPDGDMYATGEEPRGLVRVEMDERKFCASLARQAHELGITEDDWP